VNSEDLFTTEVASGRSRPLTHLPGREFRPSWSPDGENIAFIYAETTEPSFAPQRLRTIPARTETVRTAEQTHDLTDVSYTWHLPYMFFGRETPQWSPDFRGILLVEKPYYGGTNTGRLVDLSGNTHKQDRFPPAATQIQWASNRTLVYVVTTSSGPSLSSLTAEPKGNRFSCGTVRRFTPAFRGTEVFSSSPTTACGSAGPTARCRTWGSLCIIELRKRPLRCSYRMYKSFRGACRPAQGATS